MHIEKRLVSLIAELAEDIGSRKVYLKLEEQKPTDNSAESQFAKTDKIRDMKKAIESQNYTLNKILNLFE